MSNLNSKLEKLHTATKSIVGENSMESNKRISESEMKVSSTPIGMSSISSVGIFTNDKDNFISNGKLDNDDLRRLNNIYLSISPSTRESIINQFSNTDKPKATDFEDFFIKRADNDLYNAYLKLLKNSHERNRDSKLVSSDRTNGVEIYSELVGGNFTIATFRDVEGNSATISKRTVNGRPEIVFSGSIESNNVIGLKDYSTIIVSEMQPENQEENDWWYEII